MEQLIDILSNMTAWAQIQHTIGIVVSGLLISVQALLVGGSIHTAQSAPRSYSASIKPIVHRAVSVPAVTHGKAHQIVATSTQILPPPVVIAPQQASPTVNEDTRAALVNIFCFTGNGGYLYPISGSGIFIDARGVILTNAHVAQYFLLKDYPVPNNIDCVVRTGSPARSTYRAKLLYLPPKWISANATQIISKEPIGTGENDYAFLLITAPINETGSLPALFPHLTINIHDPTVDTPVLLAAYPAGFIQGLTLYMNLYASSAFTSVKKLFTFDTDSIDVLSLGGSIVAQAGSSGGAVVRTDTGNLIGIISTDSSADTTSGRDLHAITMGHIERSLRTDGIDGISGLLSGDINNTANVFDTNISPELTLKLLNVLRK